MKTAKHKMKTAKECKRHDWRLGAKIGKLSNGKIVANKQVVLCFKCGEKIVVNLK